MKATANPASDGRCRFVVSRGLRRLVRLRLPRSHGYHFPLASRHRLDRFLPFVIPSPSFDCCVHVPLMVVKVKPGLDRRQLGRVLHFLEYHCFRILRLYVHAILQFRGRNLYLLTAPERKVIHERVVSLEEALVHTVSHADPHQRVFGHDDVVDELWQDLVCCLRLLLLLLLLLRQRVPLDYLVFPRLGILYPGRVMRRLR
mmetsp:Transcript_29115/g.50240  ORF Transcript_29115/g.50240 Transcript_29115/m.50240 type:complete len:201 (+) Transcript_29115:180-782(+)